MDVKTLSKEVQILQARLEKFEDALLEGKGDREGIKDSVDYYRGEVAKVRDKYMSLISAVGREFSGND